MNRQERIGIFGGTFDPPHRTHLEIARAARNQAGLDRVLFMVSGDPPHKHGEVTIDAEDRLAMVAAALDGEPGFEVSRIEMERSGPSFTIDTLLELRRLHPEAALYLIIGYDSLLELPHWRRAPEIVQQAYLLVAPRADLPAPADGAFMARYQMLDLAPSSVSSTEIRERLLRGEVPGDWLPETVLRVIRDRGLYHVHD